MPQLRLAHPRHRRPRTDYRVTFVVLCSGIAAFSLLQSMVNPVMPIIEAALDTDKATATWVLTAYLLSASIFTPIIGRVGDKVGKERMLVVALCALAAGSFLAAIAPTIGVLIAARVIQGIGGGVVPLAFGVIRDEFPRDKVSGAVGAAAALAAAGAGAGLVVAGPIVDVLSYRWLFLLPMALTILAAVATFLYIPESPERSPGPISVGSAILMSGWLVTLLLAVSQGRTWGWSSPIIVGLFVATVVLIPCWVWAEARSSSPLIDMQMMKIPTVWTVNLVALLFGAGLYSLLGFTPQFLETSREVTGYGFGATVTEAGLILLPQTMAMFAAGMMSGSLARRIGPKAVLIWGAVTSTIGAICLVLAHDQVSHVIVETTVIGFGLGLVFAAQSTLIVDAVPQTQTGVASGMNSNIRTIGGALGSAILASVVTAGARTDGVPVESGYTHSFLLLAIAFLLAVVASVFIPVMKASVHLVPGPQTDAEALATADHKLAQVGTHPEKGLHMQGKTPRPMESAHATAWTNRGVS